MLYYCYTINRKAIGRGEIAFCFVITLWLDFYLGFSCLANSVSTFTTAPGMAEMSKTEKVQLHAPDLDELRSGKDSNHQVSVHI